MVEALHRGVRRKVIPAKIPKPGRGWLGAPGPGLLGSRLVTHLLDLGIGCASRKRCRADQLCNDALGRLTRREQLPNAGLETCLVICG